MNRVKYWKQGPTNFGMVSGGLRIPYTCTLQPNSPPIHEIAPPMPNDPKIPVIREDTRWGGEGGFTIKGGYGVLECTIIVKFPAPSPIEHDPMWQLY